MIAPIILVILGLVLAFAGRRFLWLLVGIAGFVLGYTLVTFLMPGEPGAVQILIGIVFGLIGGFLATRFTKILLLVAGFILVGEALLAIGNIFGATSTLIEVLLFVIGGLIGLALVQFALSFAVILISALGGAAMVMQGLPGMLGTTPGTINLLIGLVIAVAGFIVQWQFLKEG